MYPANFKYVRAGSVAEALTLIESEDDAKFLAGGHSLLPAMKLRLAEPATLIDIGRIGDLRGISYGSGDEQDCIGSLTSHATIASSKLSCALVEAADGIGDPQVRNRGTIGGNIAHADPASDLPTVLTALGATIRVEGPGAARDIEAGDFFTGLFETKLADNELITVISVPREGDGTGSAYAKLFNPASRYAVVGASASVILNDGKITQARVAVGGLTPMAVRCSGVEAALEGNSQDAIMGASAQVASDVGDDILGDVHASAAYRLGVLPTFVARAVQSACDRASG
jgi:carbon-monoxide dehydrogenase medium subunit